MKNKYVHAPIIKIDPKKPPTFVMMFEGKYFPIYIYKDNLESLVNRFANYYPDMTKLMVEDVSNCLAENGGYDGISKEKLVGLLARIPHPVYFGMKTINVDYWNKAYPEHMRKFVELCPKLSLRRSKPK